MHQSLARAAAAHLFVVLTALVLVPGCGQPGDPASPAASISASQKTPKSPSPSNTSPQATVVQQFLHAIQKGDQAAARNLLTAKTVEAFDEYNVPFLPSAIESGHFQIGQTVQVGNTYFVQCVWTDQDASGQARGEKIQWMVKQEDGGAWRIYGLAVYVEEEGENRVINFEKPHELVQGPQENGPAAQTSSGQAAPPQQAARPQDPFQSAPR